MRVVLPCSVSYPDAERTILLPMILSYRGTVHKVYFRIKTQTLDYARLSGRVCRQVWRRPRIS